MSIQQTRNNQSIMFNIHNQQFYNEIEMKCMNYEDGELEIQDLSIQDIYNILNKGITQQSPETLKYEFGDCEGIIENDKIVINKYAIINGERIIDVAYQVLKDRIIQIDDDDDDIDTLKLEVLFAFY